MAATRRHYDCERCGKWVAEPVLGIGTNVGVASDQIHAEGSTWDDGSGGLHGPVGKGMGVQVPGIAHGG